MKYFLFRVVFLLKIRHTRDLINAWVFLNDGKTLGKSCWYLHEVKLWKIYQKTVNYNICNAQLYFKFQIGKSNKLEKADILEMTVDFVKRSHPTTSKEGTHKMSSYLWENSFNSLTTAHNANIIFISFQKVKIGKVLWIACSIKPGMTNAVTRSKTFCNLRKTCPMKSDQRW